MGRTLFFAYNLNMKTTIVILVLASFIVCNALTDDLTAKAKNLGVTEMQDICRKQCETVNKYIKKQFQKKCANVDCEGKEIIKEKIVDKLGSMFDKRVEKFTKKVGCDEKTHGACIMRIFEEAPVEGNSPQHAHDHHENSGNLLLGSIGMVLLANIL